MQCGDKVDVGEHGFVNFTCQACNYEGLEYMLNDDKSSYSCAGWGKTKQGNIVIASKYNGLPVTSIEERAFFRCSLASATIPDSVIQIGDMAFAGSGLAYVTIGNGVTDIGMRAFLQCSLKSVIIPDSVKNIGERAFEYCSSLKNITIGSGVTNIEENAFYINDSAEAYFSSKIYYTGSITSWMKIKGVDNLMWMRRNKNLYIGGEEIKDELVIPDTVTDIPPYAFWGCVNLTRVTLGNKVKSVGKVAFGYCSDLARVTIPDGITDIEHNAFFNSRIKYNLYDKALYLGNENNPYLVLMELYNVDYTSYEIKETTKVIAGGAFYNCDKLTSVTIPVSVTRIGSDAFSACRKLKSITYTGTKNQWTLVDKKNSGFNGSVYCKDGVWQ